MDAQVQEEIESVVNTITHALKNCFSMPDLPELIEVVRTTYNEKEKNNHVQLSIIQWFSSIQGMVGKYGHVHRYLDSVKDFKERLTGGIRKRKTKTKIFYPNQIQISDWQQQNFDLAKGSNLRWAEKKPNWWNVRFEAGGNRGGEEGWESAPGKHLQWQGGVNHSRMYNDNVVS